MLYWYQLFSKMQFGSFWNSSVTSCNRLPSYAANGGPRWLRKFFEKEKPNYLVKWGNSWTVFFFSMPRLCLIEVMLLLCVVLLKSFNAFLAVCGLLNSLGGFNLSYTLWEKTIDWLLFLVRQKFWALLRQTKRYAICSLY